MKLISILFVLFSKIVFGQIDTALVHQLYSLKIEDQKWRNIMTEATNSGAEEFVLDSIHQKIRYTDSLNYIEVSTIFVKYGFPGYDIAGSGGSHNFWLLVQHQDKHPDFQKLVLDSMYAEVQAGNASMKYYAYLDDRVRVNNGQKQLYGTQMELNEDKTSYRPKPVEEPKNLNGRREKAGLKPIEVYIEQMNKNYFGTLNSSGE